MAEGQVQRAVAAHGNAADAPRFAARINAKAAFDLRQEFADQEFFEGYAAVAVALVTIQLTLASSAANLPAASLLEAAAIVVADPDIG